MFKTSLFPTHKFLRRKCTILLGSRCRFLRGFFNTPHHWCAARHGPASRSRPHPMKSRHWRTKRRPRWPILILGLQSPTPRPTATSTATYLRRDLHSSPTDRAAMVLALPLGILPTVHRQGVRELHQLRGRQVATGHDERAPHPALNRAAEAGRAGRSTGQVT